MIENKKVCPYCGDSGQIKFRLPDKDLIAIDKFGKPVEAYSYYTCFCLNNKVVSKSFNKLVGAPDITPEQAIQAGKFAGFRNLIILGNEQKFLHLVKATMVLHANYHHTFEFLNGIELVHKYYVQQPPGVFRSLADLENKDLVIFIFDAAPENKAQNTTIFEVVRNRLRMNNPEDLNKLRRVGRPTWIYSTTQASLEQSKEYSSEIKALMGYFTQIDLDNYTTPFEINVSSSSKKRSEAQDILGNL
jgi:hypothetical protein